MHLYLIRHGIAADREDPNCPPDADRPLTPKGIKRSYAAAQGLRALGVKPDFVLTSPWLRAVQTAEIFCETIHFPAKKIISTDTLKGTGAPPDLLRELQPMKDKIVFCFGHEPHLHQTIGYILHTHSKITELKKAGIALLELERISPPHGRLIALYPPSTLRLMAE